MALAGIAAVSNVTQVTQATAPTATSGATRPGAVDFASVLDDASKIGMQADELASQVSTGSVQNIQQFTSAAAKAELTVDLVVAIRNRAVEAYQEIMRMSV